MKQIVRNAALLIAVVALMGGAAAQAQDHDGDHQESHGASEHAGAEHDMHGSHSDQMAVRATVDALFDAMRAGSGEGVRAVFMDEARLMSTGSRQGEPFIRETPIDQFVGAVDYAEEGSWDERIWNVMIHISGNLATAWTPYAFYHDGALSHCGVNAFQMTRTADGWKILQLTDTRQREGCEIPDSVTSDM